MALPTFDDLVLREDNTDTNKAEANTWAEQSDLEAIINFRVDAEVYDDCTETQKVRAIVSAYRDIDKLTWNASGIRQNRVTVAHDQGFNDAPIGDVDFDRAIIGAHAAQVMFLINGSQIRDLAAQGVTLTRAQSGVETEFQGYRGPVCTEALELLSEFIEVAPRLKRMR